MCDDRVFEQAGGKVAVGVDPGVREPWFRVVQPSFEVRKGVTGGRVYLPNDFDTFLRQPLCGAGRHQFMMRGSIIHRVWDTEHGRRVWNAYSNHVFYQIDDGSALYEMLR